MKILVVTKNWLGDILFEIPAIEMIRKQYPKAEILCLTHPRCREILELHPAVNRVIAFDEKKSSPWAKLKIIFSLSAEKIDTAYFFHRSRTRAFMLMLAGVKKRVGYGIKKQNFLTLAFPEPSQALHHSDYFARLLEQDGLKKSDNLSYSFHYSEKDAEAAAGLTAQQSGPFVCFHLGANWEPKRWPAEHFAELADLIHRKWKFGIFLTGGPGDKALGEQVLAGVREAKVISVIGQTGLGELAALFASAQFVASGDSGPMHIASGVGARVIALFGPTNPNLTGPRGTGERIILSFVPTGYSVPWYGKDFPADGWLSQIKPEEVMAALEAKNWGSVRETDAWGQAGRGSKARKEGVVLVNTLSNIGDVIMTTPVIMSLAKQFPDCRMRVIVGPRAKGILEGSHAIDHLVIYDKHAPLKEKIDFVRRLRKEKYEAAVDLKNSAIPFLVSAKKRSPFIRFFKQKSARARHLEVLEMMDLETETTPEFDFFTPREQKEAFQKLKAKGNTDAGWVVIAPVAASESKTWPLEAYAKVIEGILRETPYTVVLTGGPREAQLVEPLIGVNAARILNLAGETTLRESAALIAGAKLLLANDSSAAQLGFEMNQRTAVIFGPTDPKRFAREGRRFRVLYAPAADGSLDRHFNLAPEKVLQACLELLSQTQVKTEYSQGSRS